MEELLKAFFAGFTLFVILALREISKIRSDSLDKKEF